jgi:hypothetical protein
MDVAHNATNLPTHLFASVGGAKKKKASKKGTKKTKASTKKAKKSKRKTKNRTKSIRRKCKGLFCFLN